MKSLCHSDSRETLLWRSARILRRVLKIWEDWMSFKLQWKTISLRSIKKTRNNNNNNNNNNNKVTHYKLISTSLKRSNGGWKMFAMAWVDYKGLWYVTTILGKRLTENMPGIRQSHKIPHGSPENWKLKLLAGERHEQRGKFGDPPFRAIHCRCCYL